MLEGLGEIDWGTLNHAYGAASDVPDLLRTLAGSKRKACAGALYALYGNIYHQGTVYEATSYAVPFLIELLREPTVRVKAAILGLLQAISYGNSYLNAHQDLEWYRKVRGTDPFQDKLREEMFWVRKASDAVSAGVPVYRALLAASSLKVRTASAYVLANCTQNVWQVVSALRTQLRQERNSVARASLVWAWVCVCRNATRRNQTEPLPDLGVRNALRALARSRGEKAIVRLLAGLGLMQYLPEKDYPRFARFFAAALARCPRGLARIPWAEGEPMQFVSRVLAHQRGLVLSLFSLIAQTPQHPFQEATTYYLQEIILAQPRARPAVALLLAKLLDSASGKARQHAARLLAQMGSSGDVARDVLVRALDDPDNEVAWCAASALSKRGDVRVVPYLMECLSREDTNNQVMEAINRLGGAARDTIPHLREFLRLTKGNTRVLAAHALASMGEESADAVLEVAEVLSDPTAGAGAAWALMNWGPVAHKAVPRIVEFLEGGEDDSLARLNAVKALGSMGLHARPALGLLERLLHDPSPKIRVAAAAALWNVTPRAAHAVPVLVEVLREGAGGKSGANHICSSVLEALESIGPAAISAASLARELLDDNYQWTRVHAARALWRMGERVDVFLPVLIAELRCRPAGLLAAACLTEIGPPAVAAIPRLREILTAEGGVSEGGAVDELIEREEEFLQAVSATLQSIQGNK